MSRSRSSKLENRDQQQNLSDDQLYRLILQAGCEGGQGWEQLQLTIKDIMVDDPERIRVAYRKVVMEMRSRTGASSELRKAQAAPLVTVAFADTHGSSSRASQRRKLSQASKAGKSALVILDASGVRDIGGLESLRSDMSALCRVHHQNLLCLASFSLVKGARFTLDFGLANTSCVLLRDMFQEEVNGGRVSLNGCEVACVLAQVCLGLIFLIDCVTPVMRTVEFTPAACLATDNIILTSGGLIKLCGHHQVMQLPSSRGRASANNNAAAAATPTAPGSSSGDGSSSLTSSTVSLNEDQASAAAAEDQEQQRNQPGYLAHRTAMLLYELDHPSHQALASIRRCTAAERRVLDERYARLFSVCADWEADKPVDLRSVLYCSFICEHTSSISSYQSPLEFVFAARFQ